MKPLQERLLALCAFALWFSGLWHALKWLGPASGAFPLFNSDAAIPVLMANDASWDFFRLYYYGQDRFGAWPFLAANAVSRALGFLWRPEGMAELTAAFVLTGAWPVGRLLGLPRSVGAALYVAAVLLNPDLSLRLFELGQPYAWQLPVVLWTWWGLRVVAERLEKGRPPRLALLLLSFGSFLAVWSSSVSGPLLLAAAGLEWLRSGLRRANGGRTWRRAGFALLLLVSPVAVGTTAESALRAHYNRRVEETWGTNSFRTLVTFDDGHVRDNIKSTERTFRRMPSAPLFGLALALAMGGAFLFGRRLVRSVRSRGVSASDGNVARPGLDLEVMATFVTFAAVLHYAMFISLLHIRWNQHASRYLTPVVLFASLYGLALIARVILRLSGKTHRASLTLVAAAALVTLVAAPRPVPRDDYGPLQEVASTLGGPSSPKVVLGGYWQTYVFPALAPGHDLQVIVAEGDADRTPATRALLREPRELLLAHHWHRPELGSADAPPPNLVQYGAQLSLVEPRWLVKGEWAFSKYRVVVTPGVGVSDTTPRL